MSDDTTKQFKIPSHQLEDVRLFVAEQSIAGARVAPIADQPSLTRRKPLGDTNWIEVIVTAATAQLTKELVTRIFAFLKSQGEAQTREKSEEDDRNARSRDSRDDS